MEDSKLKKILDFFMNCAMSPVILMQMIKNKTVRWVFAIPLLFLSLVTVLIFAIPVLLLIVALSIEALVNNDF